MRRIALAAAAFALLAFPVAASAAEPPADRSAADDAPTEPLEIVVKRAPWTVKAKPAKPK